MLLQVMQILLATEEPCSDLDSNSGAAGHPGAEIISGSVWISHSYLQRMEERERNSSEVSLFFIISH